MAVTNNFASSELDLNGIITLSQPTALVWGPDGRLYVSEVNGSIKVMTVAFGDPDPTDGDPAPKFYVTEAFELTTITGFNYDDDGTYNPTVTEQGRERQVTGIEVVQQYDANGDPVTLPDGKAAVDIYVTSSDPRHGAGNNGEDKNLDTNSGVVHRLRETDDVDAVATPDDAFTTVDLVRGFSRSEENHAINGLEVIQEFDETTGQLISERAIVAVGGNANTGAPSNNFAAQQEYATSAGLFEIDITMLDGMGVQTDATSGRDYIYDLPTLDDPTQTGTSDQNDPFGGNDGFNQAILLASDDPNSPVTLYSPGYRNAYDVEITDDGRVWTYDNGANNSWGGRPIGEAGDDGDTTDNAQDPNYIATNLNNGDGNSNDEINLEPWNPANLDHFHEVTRSDDLDPGETLSVGGNGPVTTYTDPDTGLTLVYGGHPNPTRAEGSKAGLLYSPTGTDDDAVLLVSDTNTAGDAGAPSDYDDVIAWYTQVESDYGLASGFLTKRVVEATPGTLYDLYEAPDGTAIAVLAGSAAPGGGAVQIGTSGLPSDIHSVVASANPIEGNYLEGGLTDGALDSAFGSINGLAEYTSTIFDDAGTGTKMSGAILASTFNGGGLIVMGRNADGTMSSVSGANGAVAADRTVILDSGQTLGLATIGDNIGDLGLSNAFQGSIWAAVYKIGNGFSVDIEIFQPVGVGIPLADQIVTDPTDQDGDGIDVVSDPFEFSDTNGYDLSVGQTLNLDFEANTSGFAGSFAGTGLLGAALDGTTPNRDAQTADELFPVDLQRDGLFDDGGNIIPGGNAPVFQIKDVAEGTVVGAGNTARDAMHTGVNLDSDVKTLISTLNVKNWIPPLSAAPVEGQLTGMMFSDGTQSNFLRVVFGGVSGTGNNPGLEVGWEIGDAGYTTLAQIALPDLSLAVNSEIELRLAVRNIGTDFDVTVEYKLASESTFTEVPLNGGAGFQLPAGVLQDVLTGVHTITDSDGPVASSGAAIGLLAETPTGAELLAIDFNNLAVEARGNEILATTAAEVGATGTAEVDTIVYTGSDVALAPLAGDVENFDGTQSLADYAVTGNNLENRIEVGTGTNTITTGNSNDTVIGTLAELSGDTITDMEVGDKIVITDLSLTDAATATFGGTGPATLTLNGATITFSGSGFDGFDPANGGSVFFFAETAGGLEITAVPPALQETTVYRINFGAQGSISAIDGGPDWADDNGVIQGFTSTLPDDYITPLGAFTVDYDNVDAAVVPTGVFRTEAGDNTPGNAPSTLDFDVEAGRTYRIEYYYTENWEDIFDNEDRVFDVSVEGAVPVAFDDLNPLAEAEAFVVANGGQTLAEAGVTNGSASADKDPYLNVARKAEYIYTATDDTLNLELIHQSQNPKINAIQISVFGGLVTDALISIGDTPTVIENGDSGTTLIQLPLAVAEPGFTGQLTLDFDVTVNGVTQAYIGQVVDFVDTGAFIDVLVPADIQNNGIDTVSVTLTDVAEAGYAIDGAAATGTSAVTEDDAPLNPTFPFVEDTNNDLSDDRFNPTDLGQLAEGDNLITSTQQGDAEPGGRERDYFTFEVPDGQVLTSLILTDYIPGEPTGTQGGFIALAAGNTVELDPTTIAFGQFIPELLGGHVYDPNEIGTDILPELADGDVFGTTMQGFSLPLGAGTYTIWLNQGGEASTPTLNLQTVLASNLPNIAITAAPTQVESGDTGVTTLTYPVTITPAEATTLTVSYTLDGGAEVSAEITFDASGTGSLSVDVDNDAVFDGTDVVDVTLTSATNGVPGDLFVIDAAASTASGSVTEDDPVPSTAPAGDFDTDMIANQDDTDIDGDGGGLADNSTSTDGVLDISETFVFDATNAGTALTQGEVVRLDFDIDGTPFMNGFTGALLSPNAQAPEVNLNAADVSGGTLNIAVNGGDPFRDRNDQENAFISAYTAPEGLAVETRFAVPDFDSTTAGVQAAADFQSVGVVIGVDQNNMVKAVWGREDQSFQLTQDNARGGGVSDLISGSGATPAETAEISIRLEVLVEGGTPIARAFATFYDATGAAIAGSENVAIGEITLEDSASQGNSFAALVTSGAPIGAGVIQTSTGDDAASSFDVSYQYVEVTALGTPVDTVAPSVALSNTALSIPEDTDLTASVKVADITITDDGVSAVSLALSGDDAGLFEIVTNGTALELHLTAGAALDFETNATLDVTVEATDSVGTGTAAFSAAVGDVNEAPTVTGTLSNAMTLPGTPTSVDLSSLVLTDEDAGDVPVLKVLVGGVDIASVPGFTLNGTTLEVDGTVAEADYAVEVFANDGALDSAVPVAFSVSVNSDIAPIPTMSVAVPTEVDGDISVTVEFGEPVFGFNPVSLTLSNGLGLSRTDGTANFQPGDSSVVVSFAAPVGGFAQDTDYSADIGEGVVLDGGGNGNEAASAAPVSFALDDAPVFVSGATSLNLAEETDGVIETYAATDADNDTVTYALDAAGQALGFTIDPNTGALSAPAGGFDFETLQAGSGTTLTFDVIASSTGTDAVAQTATTTVTVDILDQVETISVVFELENFDNIADPGDFFAEDQDAASGGQVARLGQRESGTASLTLGAGDGIIFGPNDIEIAYFDESDGVSTFTVNVNGVPLGTVTMDNDGGGNAAQAENLRTATFSNVDLQDGDVITIDGVADTGEFLRLDKLTISGSGDNEAPVAVGTIDLAGLTQGDTINVNLEGTSPVFTDADADTLTYTLSANAPDFLGVVNGVLVNTRAITNDDVVASQTAGPVTVTVTASDGIDTAAVNFDVTVANANDAPTALGVTPLNLMPSPTAITPIEASTFFDDPDFAVPGSGEDLGFSATGLPTGLSIDPVSGQITGTLNTIGTFDVIVTATDGGGLTATATLTINTSDDPVLGDPIRVQVEDFDNIADPGDFFVENQNAAEGGQVARLDQRDSGEATLAVNGLADFVPGTFDLAVGFFDENDGNSTLNVIVRTASGDQVAGVITLDLNAGGNAAQAESFREVTLSNITLPAGAELVLAGDADTGEFVRLDYIELTPTGVIEPSDALISVADAVSVTEDGDSGTTTANLDLTMAPAAAGDVDITFSTDGGTTTSVQTVSFDASGNGTLSVEIAGVNDDLDNGNEAVTVTLVDTTTDGFAIDGTNSTSVVTVTEDDGTPSTAALRINAFGGDFAAVDTGPAWLGDIVGGGARQYLVVSDDRGDTFDGYVGDVNVIPGNVPETVLDTARSSDNPFTYSIPVTDIGGAGTYRVDLYFAELFAGAQSAGNRSFDVSLEGTVITAFDNIDPGGLFGADVGVVTGSATVTDGVLDISFLQDIADNPIINGIEITKIGEIVDTTAPDVAIALAAPGDTTSPLLVTVILTDASGIDASTLGDEDIEVQVGGVPLAANTISFVGFNGTVATYSVAAPAGGWVDGDVDVTLPAGEILDLAATPNGNAALAETITLDFSAPPANPTEATAILQAAQGVDSGGSYNGGAIGSADLRIMEGNNNIQSSNFTNNSFILENTGDKQIAAVVLDFRDALYGDSVIDTDGSSGDLVTKPFGIQSGAGITGAIVTGGDNELSLSESYFFPGDEPNPDPDANAANGGFRGLLLRFDGSDDGFAGGEQIGFSGDMDPNSVAAIAKNSLDSGAVNGWDVGGISGAELIGSSFTVMFDDGTFATGYIGSDGSQSGATGKATQAVPPTAAATVTVNGASSDSAGIYGGTEPVIIVSGTAGDTVLVTMSKGLNPATNTSDNIAQDVADRLANAQPDFQVSNAGNFQTVQLTIGPDGTATVPAGAFDYNTATSNGTTFNGSAFTEAFATAPMVIAASVIDTDGEPAGPVDRVYLTSNGTPVDPDGGTGPGPSDGEYFIEQNGLLVIEMESGDLTSDWADASNYSTSVSPNVNNPNAAAGDDFIVWEGPQTFNSVNDNRIIEYEIEITTPGTYQFQWRQQVGNGTETTEHNDTWLKINADQFYAEKGNSVLKPKEAAPGTFPDGAVNPEGSGDKGFFKVYSTGSGNWKWSAKTSDGDAHDIFAEFDTPGIYTIEVAARSSSHIIDRMVLSNVDLWTTGAAQNLNLPESERANTTPNTAPVATDDTATLLGSSVLIDVLDNDSDPDGDTLTITQVSTPTIGIVTIQNGEILYTGETTSTTLIDTGFDTGADGFVFVDDALRGTSEPAYASGSDAAAGESGNGLSVTLGGLDNTNITDMSGGWETNFTMASAGSATLSFSYRLDVASGYENDEFSDVLVAIDGALSGLAGNDYIARINGGGDSGWVDVTLDLGTLSAGTHELTLGGFNNKKTFNDEETVVSFDNVTLTSEVSTGAAQSDSFTYTISDGRGGTSTATVDITPDPSTFNAVSDTVMTSSSGSALIDVLANDIGGTAPYSLTSVSTPENGTAVIQGDSVLYTPGSSVGAITPLDAAFDTGVDGFVFSDDLFRGTSNPDFSSGSFNASGGNTGGGLEVVVGGQDNTSITDGMSGGWSQDVTLAGGGQASISFAYNLSVANGYESDEFGEALFAVNGNLIGLNGNDYLAQINGGGSTGWQSVTLDLGELDAGVQSFDFGAFNNKKTFNNEITTVLFDDITLSVTTESDSFTYVATDADGDTDTGLVIISFDDIA